MSDMKKNKGVKKALKNPDTYFVRFLRKDTTAYRINTAGRTLELAMEAVETVKKDAVKLTIIRMDGTTGKFEEQELAVE